MVPSGPHDAPPDARLLLDLADGGLLGRLALLEVALRQAPLDPARPVEPSDDRRAGLAGAAVDHQSARRRLLHGRQGPARPTGPPREAGGGGHAVTVASGADHHLGARGGALPRPGSVWQACTSCPTVPPAIPPTAAWSASAEEPGNSDAQDRARRRLAAALVELDPAITGLAERFTSRGHRLALVGGPVRDAVLGRRAPDHDFTTDARARRDGAAPAPGGRTPSGTSGGRTGR